VITEQEFVRKAILTLRKPPYEGIDSLHSGFREAFVAYFNKDPQETIDQLVKKGELVLRSSEGRMTLYLPKGKQESRAERVLRLMGLS
jgi:hypothetical protein